MRRPRREISGYHDRMARKRRPARRRRASRPAPRARDSSGLTPRLARLPPLGWALIGLTLFLIVNFAVQVVRKPTEILGLVFAPAPLSPEQTWSRYASSLQENSTDLVRPELLGALVQVESAGDPLARTYWRWRWTLDPFRMYAPASSAVGLLQITDGTFDQAKHYCIHGHRVARDDGPITGRCWLNSLYFRTVPGHAIEMTAAWLHLGVEEALSHRRSSSPSTAQKDALAATVHLCGRARATALAAHGFRAEPGERCGDQDLRAYLARVRVLTAQFEKMDR
jgi:hypothetical protein